MLFLALLMPLLVPDWSCETADSRIMGKDC